METQTNKEIKKIIMTQLPRIMKTDPDMRRFILSVTHEQYADKKGTESRFDRIMDELKRDREARDKKWEANQKTINEILASIKAADRRFNSTIGALGSRWGLRSEGTFRDGLKAILEESFGVKVERYEDYDHDGIVFGRPDQIEMDVIIYNGTLILCEIKSSISKSEMYTFWRKKEFYEKKHDRKVSRVMVISPMIDNIAKKVAENLNIELYGYADDVKI
ncbi:MAG: DUF3782 domain-containing protein [Thermodesulfobacteriota bacterium]|nr:DUF3782 domain-containing protein [Thermodesulfobacteriota bacterium]